MSDHNPEHSGDAGQTGADAPVTLATVVDCLGPGTVAMWAAPHGLGVPVRALAVHEGPAGPGRSGPARPGGYCWASGPAARHGN